jgi:glycosyltransferase involved in cell wall biosynthesis
MQKPLSKTGVLFLSSPEWPGADTFVHTLIIRNLDRSQFDVHVGCSPAAPGASTSVLDGLSAIPGIHVRPSNFGPSLFAHRLTGKVMQVLRGLPSVVASFAGLVRYIRRHRIAILHATDRPRDAVWCVTLAMLTGTKSVVHLHLKFADWMSGPQRWAFRRADALIGVSRFVARSLIDNGYSPEKTYAVLNAIEIEKWDPGLDPMAVRLSFGIASDTPVIACAARLFRGKGQDELIRTLAIIREEIPTVRLMIIGADDRQAMRTSFTAELKQLASDLRVSEHVIFTGQRHDMPALLAACDVFALASMEEPFGLVYLEAMAMKKPVVALASGGTLEIVEHEKSGLLSEPGDSAALAANLVTLLRNPDLRARMGEYGRIRVETAFTPRRLAKDTESVYYSLLR